MKKSTNRYLMVAVLTLYILVLFVGMEKQNTVAWAIGWIICAGLTLASIFEELL